MQKEYTLECKLLTPEDAERCAILHQESFPENCWNKEYFKQATRSPTQFGLGVFDSVSGELLGFILGQKVLDEVEILTLVVVKNYRRQGVAFFLLSKTLLHCRAAQVTSIFLEVNEKNDAAQKLYITNGFHEISRRKNYYNTGALGLQDALILKISLFK